MHKLVWHLQRQKCKERKKNNCGATTAENWNNSSSHNNNNASMRPNRQTDFVCLFFLVLINCETNMRKLKRPILRFHINGIKWERRGYDQKHRIEKKRQDDEKNRNTMYWKYSGTQILHASWIFVAVFILLLMSFLFIIFDISSIFWLFVVVCVPLSATKQKKKQANDNL